MNKKFFITLTVVLAAAMAVPVLAGTVAELERPRDGQLLMVGFELSKGAEIDIEAVGIRL